MSRYDRREFLRSMGYGALGLMGGVSLLRSHSAAAQAAEGRPNFVFILIDDLGWADTGCYGNAFHETPNIDRLASQGMRFTDAYAAAPLCSATRASILSGKYPARLHITAAFTKHDALIEAEPAASGPPWARLALPTQANYLPLEELTLAEALKGAGYATGFFGKWHVGPEGFWPRDQGFDVNVAGGHYPSPPSYFAPYRIKTITDGEPGEYLTDRLTGEAEAFLESSRDGPFLMHFSHYAVHTPLQAKQPLIDRYDQKADDMEVDRNTTYAAMIQSVDESVGRIMRRLDELGIAERTVVFFMSDNGGLLRIPRSGESVTSNAPLRGGKAMLYEGGIREPMMVRWPGVVEAESVCSVPVVSVDFYPTMLDIAGLGQPPGQTVDGESFLPLLKQTGALQRESIYFHFPHYIAGYRPDPDKETFWTTPCAAVRKGDYKLIKFFEGRLELYNLREDLSETSNLAAKMPERAGGLERELDAWLAAVGAHVPVPNPDFDPNTLRSADGWRARHDSAISAKDGILRIECTGNDPYLLGPSVRHEGAVVVKLRAKCAAAGKGGLYWITAQSPRFHRNKLVAFDLLHDDRWHEYAVELPVRGALTRLRLDPGTAPGVVEIDWIRVHKAGEAEGAAVFEWTFEQDVGG